MLHVCGLALDWLAADGVLSAAERAGLVSAIVGTGLARVRAALSPSPPPWAVAFVSTRSNWNTVILGGSIIAALAVAGEAGAPAWVQEELLPRALANLGAWSALGWGPDGAWAEGPNYAGYAARYLAPTVAVLRSATGSDAGLSALPGVLLSPRFLLAAMAPNLEYFYYYDTRCDPETVASYLAFAVLANDADSQRGVAALTLALAPSVPHCNKFTLVCGVACNANFTQRERKRERERERGPLMWGRERLHLRILGPASGAAARGGDQAGGVGGEGGHQGDSAGGGGGLLQLNDHLAHGQAGSS